MREAPPFAHGVDQACCRCEGGSEGTGGEIAHPGWRDSSLDRKPMQSPSAGLMTLYVRLLESRLADAKYDTVE